MYINAVFAGELCNQGAILYQVISHAKSCNQLKFVVTLIH